LDTVRLKVLGNLRHTVKKIIRIRIKKFLLNSNNWQLWLAVKNKYCENVYRDACIQLKTIK